MANSKAKKMRIPARVIVYAVAIFIIGFAVDKDLRCAL